MDELMDDGLDDKVVVCDTVICKFKSVQSALRDGHYGSELRHYYRKRRSRRSDWHLNSLLLTISKYQKVSALFTVLLFAFSQLASSRLRLIY
jgi:hypothetical protein